MSERDRDALIDILLTIEPLSYDELIDLNNIIVDRIEYLEAVDTQKKMMEFVPGSRVSFDSKQGHQTGTIMKFNRKTVSVITDSHRRFNVAPQLLRKEIKDSNQKPRLVSYSKPHKQ